MINFLLIFFLNELILNYVFQSQNLPYFSNANFEFFSPLFAGSTALTLRKLLVNKTKISTFIIFLTNG